MVKNPKSRHLYMAAGATVLLVGTFGAVLAYPHLPYQAQHPFTTATTAADGTTIYNRDHKTAVTDDGYKYAPAPAQEFKNQKCDLTPKNEVKNGDPNTVTIPGTSLDTTVLPAADLTHLPAAPDAAWDTRTPSVTSTTGSTVIAGHVDYAPGALSKAGGELSGFGSTLHTLHPCTHIYATDQNGTTQETVLTSLYRVNQADIPGTGIYTDSPTRHLNLVTCAGKSLAEVGGENQFHYEYNLIASASPVKAVK